MYFSSNAATTRPPSSFWLMIPAGIGKEGTLLKIFETVTLPWVLRMLK